MRSQSKISVNWVSVMATESKYTVLLQHTNCYEAYLIQGARSLKKKPDRRGWCVCIALAIVKFPQQNHGRILSVGFPLCDVVQGYTSSVSAQLYTSFRRKSALIRN